MSKNNALRIKNNGGQALRYNSGQAMLMTVILFLFLSVSFITGVSDPILRQANITKDLLNSKRSYFLSESGVEDAIFRIKNNRQISASEELSLDGNIVTTTITDTLGVKTIETLANTGDLVRKIGVTLETGVGSSFNYGIQSGAGGFILGENTTINGSVYANGPITGSNNTSITGSAISANSSVLSANQINDTPSTPDNSISFGTASSNQDLGQSFQVSTSEPLTKVSLYIKKVGAPSSLNVRITTDNAGKPSTNTIVSATLSNSLVTSNYAWVDASFSNYIELSPGVTYWLVLDGGSSATKYYIVGANNSYANGGGKVGQYSGVWNNTNPGGLDAYFKIYLGGINGLIDEVNVGSGGVGDVEAYQVTNSSIAGSLYCQTGSGNNKSCNTSRTVPTALDLPISDGNIDKWKSDAEAGGVINGDYTLSSSISLGPKKIDGNLTIDGSKVLTLTGTIWVTGNVEMENGAKIKLHSSYGANSGIVVADKRVAVENNSVFEGSGQSGSYVMILTTSDCPISDYCAGSYAMDISNNVDAVILNAQKGTIRMSNNANAKQITAYRIFLDNNTTLDYEQGIANTSFTSGPTGGWTINSWAETE